MNAINFNIQDVAEAINQQIVDTEDFMMANNYTFGESVVRYDDVVVKVETDYHEIRFSIAIANAPVDEAAVYTTWDFEDAVEAAWEASEISFEIEAQKVRF